MNERYRPPTYHRVGLGAVVVTGCAVAVGMSAVGCEDEMLLGEAPFSGVEVEGTFGDERFFRQEPDPIRESTVGTRPFQIDIDGFRLEFVTDEPGTYDGEDHVRIRWSEEIDYITETFYSDRCDSESAEVTIKYNDYGLVVGTFDGQVCTGLIFDDDLEEQFQDEYVIDDRRLKQRIHGEFVVAVEER